MRRLPPLNSLRAFESAARWLSFSKAADELFVTPAAISPQIKQLETYLGVPLFHRMTRAVRLTEEARTVLPLISEGFDKLADAVEHLTQDQEAGVLTVSSAPTFAQKWLLPRLPDFADKHPQIDLRLDASLLSRDFERDGIDIGIRLGLGDYPGLHAERVFGEQVSVVCSPKLLIGETPLKTPADLKHVRLLHVDWGQFSVPLPDWQMWLKAAGLEDMSVKHGPTFTVENMAVEAAAAGNGVALVSNYAVTEELAAGRLVRPFDLALRAGFSYWLVCPHAHMRRAKVKAFSTWLMDQAAQDSTSRALESGTEAQV